MTLHLPDQHALCRRFGAAILPTYPADKLGVALASFNFPGPVNGLRHKPEGGTCGWYIWAGELSEDPDFFQPLHAGHLSDIVPSVLPYLGLPPGWRFLLAPDHEDVWFDQTL